MGGPSLVQMRGSRGSLSRKWIEAEICGMMKKSGLLVVEVRIAGRR